MENQNRFSPDIVEKIIEVLNKHKVEYLIIGKGGAVFYGYNSTTFDIDIFPKKEPKNGERIVKALRELGYRVDENMEKEIICGKDFIQIREGPFGIDLVFAPDGIESFEAAKKRATLIDGKYPVSSLKDIIQSKEKAKRRKDMKDLEDLKEFAKYLQERETK